MRLSGLLIGVALACVAVRGVGVAVAGPQAGRTAPIASAASVTRAFAAQGIPLEQKAPLMAARGTNGLPRLLWNRALASSQGVITVQVLRTAADARSLPARLLKTDTCAGFPTSYLTVRSRYVVATYTSCVTLSSPIHLATEPVLTGFVAAMQSLR